ncbi:DUF1588 domain-containing protein [Stieleria sp. ICT_E10.1]|uniref:DUF1588 domain-containing protein n=1 Tax=Stieleria sedimenti TaxID=2976331 RepID=UPI00217F5446|nr:DUF1588 domain-containing protein [Stieleria sedimenti]MCS7467507.1 DUF1588 domain-containing protein [Stieleria sedimenti]
MNSSPAFDAARLPAAPLAPTGRLRLLGAIGVVLLAVGAGWHRPSAAESPGDALTQATLARGNQIYAQQCLSCHGEGGRGETDGYADPLVGDASIGELAEIISDTMPEEDPGQCIGDDAKAVAEFIYESFYSEAAQLRNRPARQQFSRLTGTQLQQSLADLYQHFFGTPFRVQERGLSASYFDSGRWDKKHLKVERVDPVLDFDFGHDPPVEGVTPEEFYIHWSGSLQVEHTGRYEIVVHSTCSMKVRFGHHEHVLIDNHVQSEGRTEFRRTLNLIGGRQYAIQIDFTQRKRKTEQPPATFSLRWVPPGGTETVIPNEYLLPSTLPSGFALQTKLPPDDRSYGYDRGTRVDRQWEDAITSAALEFGDAAVKELWPQYKRKHRKDSDENRGRLRGFLTELASVAFRGPIDDQTKQLYVDDQVDAVEDDQMAIARACLMIIKSPRFLYPTLDHQAPISRRVATRLALTLFDSLPSDAWLQDQTGKDSFAIDSKSDQKNAEQRIRQAALRMVEDPRLHGKAMEMFFDWLDVDPAAEVSKDPEKYAGFDTPLLLDLRRSLEAAISDVLWSESSDYRQLFLRDWNWTNERLGEFYGEGWMPASESTGHRLVGSKPAAGKTFGVLTHPLVMGHLSYYDTTSPIHRGVFLIRRVLGRTLRPPNEAFTPINPELHPQLTTRQRVELQTGEAKCQVCHQKINALGFPLENYDAVGRFRATEKGKPIDASGGYVTRDGQQVAFASPGDLARFLAENDDAHRAFVERAFEHFAKQPLAAYGEAVANDLVRRFRESDFHIRHLIVEIAVVVATEEFNKENLNEST